MLDCDCFAFCGFHDAAKGISKGDACKTELCVSTRCFCNIVFTCDHLGILRYGLSCGRFYIRKVLKGIKMKNFLKTLLVIATMGFVVLLCDKMLLLKSEDGIEQMESYYLQKENTVDVLFLGSSHIYCDVNTGILWDEYGIAGYDLGGAEQPYWNSYFYLKEALKTQQPKVIVLDITTPGVRSVDLQPENWVICNNYGMHWSKNRIDALKVSTLEQSFERLLFPINTIHSRYDELTKDDFIDNNQTVSYKGFDPREKVTSFETPDISDVTEMMPVSEKAETYLKKIIELTEQKSIPLLMISAPYVVSEESQKLYNYVFHIAEENEISYMDFNKVYDKMGLDFHTDMAEDLHLNISGNAKFTKYLGKSIVELYDIPDRRQDAKYGSWEVDALNQRQESAKVMLTNEGSIDHYLTQLRNEQYLIFFLLGSGTEELKLNAKVNRQLSSLGITENEIVDGEAVIVNNGTILFESNENEFKNLIVEEKERLLYYREAEENEKEKTGIYINENAYSLDYDGMSILVYDKQLNQVVDKIHVTIQEGFPIERLYQGN